jgi:hypothetical protein
MFQVNERVSIVAVSLLGGIGLGLVVLMGLHPADVAQCSVPLATVVGALAGIVSSHPRPQPQSNVETAGSVTVEAPSDQLKENSNG